MVSQWLNRSTNKKVLALGLGLCFLFLAFGVAAHPLMPFFSGSGSAVSGTGGGGSCVDSNTATTRLLIHSNTTDGSVVFVDSSVGGKGGTGHTITANGAVHHEIDQQYFGTTSIYFDADNDYFTLADHSDWYLGTTSFTFAVWIRPANVVGEKTLFQLVSATTNEEFRIGLEDAKLKTLYTAGGASEINFLTGTTNIVASVWTHVALVRDGNDWIMFLNGVSNVSLTNTVSLQNFTNGPAIGYRRVAINNYFYYGYLDEIVFDCSALWTTSFTPPVLPYCD